jgi:hypothetical protein
MPHQIDQARLAEYSLLSGSSTPALNMKSLVTPLRCLPLDEEERLLVWKVKIFLCEFA